MADYFFYGTLSDPLVLSLVTGRRMPLTRLRPATLSGYTAQYVTGRLFPVLIEAPGEAAEGVFVAGLREPEAHRIHQFEDDGYTAEIRDVATRDRRQRPALVFMGTGRLPASDEPWDLRQWQLRHRRRYLTGVARWVETLGK